MTEETPTPDGMVQVDVNLVLQGYRDLVAAQAEQIVVQSARMKMLENANGGLVVALQGAHAALTQAQADQEAAEALATTTHA